jgi:8-oxo-dGTP pyrophosphatase MutT (NUDIX family)
MPTDYNQSVDYTTEHKSNADHFITRLQHALRDSLPGVRAQLEMAPLGREEPGLPSHGVRQSAVLALLHQRNDRYRIPDALSLIFTLRPTSLRHHAGQISFPGGGVEPQDESLAPTALRETAEELGIPTATVRILGKMTPLYITPSRNLVHPFVGWLPRLPPLIPDPLEVSEILDVPLGYLLDSRNLGSHTWYRNGEALTAPSYVVPAFVMDRHGRAIPDVHIWGATAMMLSELLTIVRPLIVRSRQSPSP